jgi:hypothetical protein
MKRLTYLVCVCFLSTAMMVGCGEKKSDEPDSKPADDAATKASYDTTDNTGGGGAAPGDPTKKDDAAAPQ